MDALQGMKFHDFSVRRTELFVDFERDVSEENNFSEKNKNLSEELDKLNNLLKDGVLTQEEFEKAKKKILDN